MSLQDISLPIDIPWKLIATSNDMLANHQNRFPHAMWKSSMAVFSYDPNPDTDLPDEISKDRELTFLKVVCSITSYVPPCGECPPAPQPVVGIEDYGDSAYQQQLKAWEEQCEAIRDAEHKVYPCSGALIQVAIYPKNEKKETVNPQQLAYFASFEPQKRELIEVVTESGESMTQSKSGLNVRKGTTATNSTEDLDVLTGVNVGGGFAGASAQVGVSGQWGTIKKSGSEHVDVTNSDSSREMREGSSHTTSLSQLYHLLNSYHVGTNRAIFFVQPRPHTSQQKDKFTFIDGPQEIEGIQEFFLIVSRPKGVELDEYCVDALLYTAHLDDTTAKAIIEPKTAETPWIDMWTTAQHLQTDNGGGFQWWMIFVPPGIPGVTDPYTMTKDAIDEFNNQKTKLEADWNNLFNGQPSEVGIKQPAILDGYITPAFLNDPSLTSLTQALLDPKESDNGWKIDRTRGLGGYDLWEDANNQSGTPRGNDKSASPPQAFIDVVSYGQPDNLSNYLPDYGLRVRAYAWPWKDDNGQAIYHGRVKGYFIRNDLPTNQRVIDMLITVRGTSTCNESPFFDYHPDNALKFAPSIASEIKIHPHNVSPWNTPVLNNKPWEPTFIEDPNDSSKKILVSAPQNSASPSGLDYQAIGAARAKMANSIGQQVLHNMNIALSCLTERAKKIRNKTAAHQVKTYYFRETDFFFHKVARKFLDIELRNLAPKIDKEPHLINYMLTHRHLPEIQAQLPSISMIREKVNRNLINQRIKDDKAQQIKVQRMKASNLKKSNPDKKQTKKGLVIPTNRYFPILTFANKQLPSKSKTLLNKAGIFSGIDLINMSTEDLVQRLNMDENKVRKLRLQILGLDVSEEKN